MATINHKTYNEATETFKDFNVYDGKETLIFKVDGADQTVYASNIIGSGIIKTSDNGPLSATAKYLSDGLGNDSVLALSTSAVGIGTNTPNVESGYGALTFNGTSGGILDIKAAGADVFRIYGTATNSMVRTTTATPLLFGTSDIERMRISSAGNVGIGTNNPQAELHLSGSGIVEARITGSVEAGIILDGTYGQISNYGDFYLTIASASGDLIFRNASSTERMRITSAGNVGIGTSSPAAKLDVAFPSSGTGAVFGYTGGTNNPRIFLNVNESTSKAQIIMSGSSGALDLGLGAGGTEIITLKGTGNVGIGTSSPASKLHIYDGDSFLGLDWASANYDATPRQFRIASNGDNSGYITQAAYNSSATAATTFFRSYVNAASSGALVFESGAGNFNTNSGIPSSYTECVRITSAGQVVIGGTTAGTSLNRSLTVNSTSAGDYAGLICSTADTQRGYYSGTSTGLEIGVSGNNRLTIWADGAQRLRVDSDGLKFGTDSAAANALDDYEEGTFNFDITFGGSDTGVTYLNRLGNYTKIGRQVTCQGWIRLANKGTATGNAAIKGLPFTIGTGAQFYNGGSIGYIGGISFADQISCYALQGDNGYELVESSNAGVLSSITDADFTSSAEIMVSFTYFV